MEKLAEPNRRFTLEEYIQLEATSEEKHEFRDGEIISMAGGTLSHSGIITNLIGELRNRLKGSQCRVYDSNLRIQIARKRLYSYPDALVICGEPIISDVEGMGPTYINPKMIVEVLSPSTREFDLRNKFDRFREIPSFEAYLLLEQDEPRAETRYRHPDHHWALDFALGLKSTIRLHSLNISLPLDEIYAGITLPVLPEPITEEPHEK
jgi:Uma2 family endonuclease